MKKYYVRLLNDSFEVSKMFETDSVKTALNKWLSYSIIRPTMADILCGSKEDCMLLYQEFLRHDVEYFNKYWVGGRFPYRYDYIRNNCQEYLVGSRNLYFSGTNTFYDSVPLFCCG